MAERGNRRRNRRKERRLPAKKARDVEKTYVRSAFVAKLRRFADALEAGEAFSISVAGERLRVPRDARFSIEHERGDGDEELEFQIKWKSQD
ncbi:MAG: amphi-Trp domain-containing protein [Parvularculaceae bacterium]|nr:amphi-Trp domain-containing protein [Parvularculaceae bacterium]